MEKSSFNFFPSIFLAFERVVWLINRQKFKKKKRRKKETLVRSSQNKRETKEESFINIRKNKCFERNASCATNTETRTTKP